MHWSFGESRWLWRVRASRAIGEETLMLAADPRGAEASIIAGVSVAELETMLENIRWFSRLSLGQKLAMSELHQRRARRLVKDGETRGA